MPLLALLNRVCDIWGVIPANPEIEDDEEKESVVYSGVPCRVDSILFRRSYDETISGGTPGVKQAIIFIQDPRLQYPENFNEDNWIVEGGIRYEIMTVDEADSMFDMHHFEVRCQAGVTR